MEANQKTPEEKAAQEEKHAERETQQVIMAPLPPNHNIPGPPHFRYFSPGSIISQIRLVLAAATAFIDFQNMARAQRTRADYKNRFLVSYRKKGTRAPALRFVLLLGFERATFRKTKGATPPR